MHTVTHNRFLGMFAFLFAASVVWGVVSPDTPASGAVVLERVQVALHSSVHDAMARMTSGTPGGRVWRPWLLERVTSTGSRLGVHDPRALAIGADDGLFVLDRGGLVKKFDSSYNLTQSYGGGDGLTVPTTFAVDAHGKVWTSDPNDRIRSFDRDGNVRDIWPREARGLEIALLKDRLVVFTSPTPDNRKHDGLFTSYTLNGEKIGSFGFLLAEQERNWIAAVGLIVPDDDGEHFFYIAQYGGLLARFTAEGKLDYATRTVDRHLPMPTVERLAGGAIRLAPGAVTSVGITLDGDRLYVLGRLTTSFGTERVVVDVYNGVDGSYLYTYRAPEFCSRILIAGGRVYTSGRGSLTEWRHTTTAPEGL